MWFAIRTSSDDGPDYYTAFITEVPRTKDQSLKDNTRLCQKPL